MSKAVLIGIGIFIVILLIIARILKRRTPRTQVKIDPTLEQVFEKYNVYVGQYNDILTEMNIADNKVREELTKHNNFEAFASYKAIVEDYNFTMESAKSKFDNINSILNNNGNIYNIVEINFALEKDLEKAKHLVYELETLEIKDTVAETTSNNTQSFFEGCKTKEEATKRYKSLAKAFHPDTGYGNKDLFEKMQEEYETLEF